MRAFDDDAIALHAKRIHGEHGCLTPLADGREEDPDVVVAVALVPIAERRADRPGLGEGANAEVDRLGRVPDEDLGGVGCWPTVDWRVEREAGETRRLAPDGFVEPAIDDDLRLDARRRDLEVPIAAVVGLGRIGRE